MPPALVVTFGPLPLSDDETTVMERFDHRFGDLLSQTALFRVSALEPKHGLLLFLHDVMGVTDVQSFVYSYTHFANAVGGTRPPPEKFLDFFEMHGAEFSIASSIGGGQVALAKDRIVARIMRLLDLSIEDLKATPADDGGEDDPISSTTKESLEQVYFKKYGEHVIPSELPSSTVLGRMHRSIMTGSFSLIKVTSIVPQDAFSLSSKDEMILTSGGGFKRKRDSSKIQNLEEFYHLMEVMMQGYVFVSVGAPAPHPDWEGRPDYGKVANVRLQFSRAGKEKYISWLRALGKRLGEPGLGLLMTIEMDCRKQWVDAIHSKIQMESVVRQSIIDCKGSADQKITAFIAGKRPKLNPQYETPKKGGPKGPIDYSALPGFDPKISTGKSYRGKPICKKHADGRKCDFGSNCRFAHVCDIVINERGEVCGSTEHTRGGHKSATAAARPQGGGQEEGD